MKTLLLLAVVFSGLSSFAQEYKLSFKGSGASSTVETVKIENLTRGNTVIVNGSDNLRLAVPTGIKPERYDSSAIMLYPNPMNEAATLEITPPVAGNATISVVDVTGKILILIRNALDMTRNTFRLTGLRAGLYIVQVDGTDYHLSARLVSSGTDGIPVIRKLIAGEFPSNTVKAVRGVKADRYMDFSYGDLLKITGKSGKYSTIVMDIPEGDKVITFNFVPCTDGDNNNYPVVKIGEYTWMAENLKTTKYNDRTLIPFQVFNADTPDSVIWTHDGYSWYNNDQSHKDVYGALYKINTFKSGKLCPAGWHAPNHSEWVNLADVLGGPLNAGGRLKETGTSHWSYPNKDATNESGFTALPGGRLDHDKFLEIKNLATFWSVTKCGGSADCGWSVTFSKAGISWSDLYEEVGYSVRCVYGEEPMIPEVRTTPHFSFTSLPDENIEATRAYTEFSVYNDNGLPVTSSGVCWSESPMPTINDPHTSNGSGVMTGLTPGTSYYVRAYATNSAGTGYGMNIPFITRMIDVEGNLYSVIKIANQLWFRQNLRTTKYKDNLSIPHITGQADWSGATDPAYCISPGRYPDERQTEENFLYNWYTINTGKLCPADWHVPSDAEWTELSDYLVANGYNYDGSTTGNKIGISMSADATFESSAVEGAVGNRSWPYLSIQKSGFEGSGVGLRDASGFSQSWKGGYWWSSSQSDEKGILRYLYYDKVGLNKEIHNKSFGLSVRCIKNLN